MLCMLLLFVSLILIEIKINLLNNVSGFKFSFLNFNLLENYKVKNIFFKLLIICGFCFVLVYFILSCFIFF